MFAPRTITMHLDDSNVLRSHLSPETDMSKYIHAMQVLQHRTGRAPRAALQNFIPTFVSSFAGPLTAAPVSGRPHHLQAEYEAVTVSDNERVLFIKGGDQYILRVDVDGKHQETFLNCSYAICPQISLTGKPLSLRNPVDDLVADHDTVRLLTIAQQRELSSVELYFVSRALPAIWAKHGGFTIDDISTPSPMQTKACIEFAAEFTDPTQKLADLAASSPAWAHALGVSPANDAKTAPEHEPAVSPADAVDEDKPSARPRLRM